MASGLNPADWALCRGLFAGKLSCGVGLEVARTSRRDDLGGFPVLADGDRVLGTPDWFRLPSAGAADLAVLEHWTRMPDGRDFG